MHSPFLVELIINNRMNFEERYIVPLEMVEDGIKNGFSHATCEMLHGGNCNLHCVSYLWRVSSNTYKIYATAYLVQLIYKIRKMRKNPMREGIKFLLDLIKSISLTSVQMMLMRRILCLGVKYYRNAQNNLIAANFFSAMYLVVESPSRQVEIALYQLTNTIVALYRMADRRGMVRSVPMGESLLFAVSIATLCLHYFQNQGAFRKGYIQSIFSKLIGDF